MIRYLLRQPTGLLIQGITGRQGRLETEWMLASGTRISAGVTPGRGGSFVHGIPIYDTVKEAVATHGNVVSMIYAPPVAAGDAAREAVESGIRLAVVSAERVPTQSVIRAIEVADEKGAFIIGPNSQGIVVPGVGRIGCPGGMDPDERFAPGDVAVVSRSGGMGSEISMLLKAWGFGTSVQVHIGGSPLVATTLTSAVQLVQQDASTKRTVVFGEPSSTQENDLADALANGRVRAPLIVMVPGRFADSLPASLPFGHAPRSGSAGNVTVHGKLSRLQDAGALIANDFSDQRELVTATTGRY